jgi:NitT/TauT family transport system substrate-binding protein
MLTAADFQPTTGNTEILVKADSPIKSFADLAGKTVATINLQGLFNLGVNYAVEKSGGDPMSVKALAMAPADEGPALLAGRVDAIVLQDPFLSQNKAAGGFRSLGNPFKLFPFKVPVGAFWSSKSTISAKGPLLKQFLAAWKESVASAKKHPNTTREVISKYTGISKDMAAKITVPDYTSGLPPNSLGPMLVLMKKYGWLNIIPSYNQIYWGGK